MRHVVDWEYVRRELGEAARFAGFLVVAVLSVIGALTVLGWLGLGA